MPNASFTHRTVISQPADHVWARLQDAGTWANIGPVEEVWDEVHDESGHLQRYAWSTSVGPRAYRGHAQVIGSDPGSVMRLALDGGELAGTLTTTLSKNGDDATHIEVTLHVESRGTLSTMFFPLVAEVVGRGLPGQVEEFARSFDES